MKDFMHFFHLIISEFHIFFSSLYFGFLSKVTRVTI